MKTKLAKPVLIMYNPELQMGAYIVESDSGDPFQNQVYVADGPIEELPKDALLQPMGGLLNPSLGWRILSSARPYIGGSASDDPNP